MSHRHLILDASVLVSWVLQDAVPARAQRVRELLGEGAWTASAPALVLWESASALVKAYRRKLLLGGGEGAWRRLEGWLAVLDLEPPGKVLRNTYDMAIHHGLSAYDAAYLELALRRKVALATLDATLEAAARSAGVAVDF